MDAGTDAATDAGTDAATDAGTDSGTDAGACVRTFVVERDIVNPGTVSLAWDGSGFGYSVMVGFHSYYHRITDGGATIGGPIEISPTALYKLYPRMIYDGEGFAIATFHDSAVGLTRVNSLGGQVAFNIVGTPASGSPDVAATGVGFGVLWRTASEVRFAVVDRALEPSGGGGALSVIPPLELGEPEPRLVWTGSELIVVRLVANQIRTNRYTPFGVGIPPAQTVAMGSSSLGASLAVAVGGETLGVVYRSGAALVFRELTLEGDAVGAEHALPVHAASTSAIELAFSPAGWAVAVGYSDGAELIRLDSSGALRGPPEALDEEGPSHGVDVVWADGAWGVAWTHDHPSMPTLRTVNFAIACAAPSG